MTEPKSIVMVAGEASGDLHGSRMIKALRKRQGDLFICGVGGHAMEAAGAKILINADQLAVVGITEAIAKAPIVLKAISRLKKLLSSLRPDLLVLIDFPDFNLHLARIAKKLGIPVMYYISPQIWAWRAGRIKKIKARVDHMAVILPFEKAFYEKHKVPVTFVGHPLMDGFVNLPDSEQQTLSSISSQTLGLLPGSRNREVRTLLPIMLDAGQTLQQMLPDLRLTVSCAPSIDGALIEKTIAQGNASDVQISSAPVKELLPACDLAIVASGTVTLEAAILGVPMIITYRVSPLSYWIGKALVDVDHIGLVNLIARNRIVPELVQKQVTAEAIVESAYAILSDHQARAEVCSKLKRVRERLGQPGASGRAADIACQLMGCSHVIK